MLELKEANPLPVACQKCEVQWLIYEAADEDEKLRLELEEDYSFDCGSCEHGGERFYFVDEDGKSA